MKHETVLISFNGMEYVISETFYRAYLKELGNSQEQIEIEVKKAKSPTEEKDE